MMPNRREAIDRLRDQITNEIRRQGYEETAVFGVRLGYEEAISNAFRHGNRNRPESHVEISYFVDSRSIYLRITDEGDGFNPDDVPDPTLDENLDKLSGRGLLLMRAYMTSVIFNSKGNQVTLIRDRNHHLKAPE